jgi:hypothetical protein
VLRCSEANAFATSNTGIVLREAEIQRQRSAARQLLAILPEQPVNAPSASWAGRGCADMDGSKRQRKHLGRSRMGIHGGEKEVTPKQLRSVGTWSLGDRKLCFLC